MFGQKKNLPSYMGDTFEEALLNSLIATGYKIPSKDKGIMLSSGGAKEKASLLDAAQALVKNLG